MEKRENDYIRRIDEMGGMIPPIERGFPQTEIANASFEYQLEIEAGQQKIVGVNSFVEQNEDPIDLLQIDESASKHQLEKLSNLKSQRDNARVAKSLDELRRAARTQENTVPFILDAVRTYATLGEICEAFRDVFGTWAESNVL